MAKVFLCCAAAAAAVITISVVAAAAAVTANLMFSDLNQIKFLHASKTRLLVFNVLHLTFPNAGLLLPSLPPGPAGTPR